MSARLGGLLSRQLPGGRLGTAKLAIHSTCSLRLRPPAQLLRPMTIATASGFWEGGDARKVNIYTGKPTFRWTKQSRLVL